MSPNSAPPKTEIRPAHALDAEELAKLHVAVWRATYRDFATPEALAKLDETARLPFWRTMTASELPQPGALVAERASAVIGVVSFARGRHPAFGGRMEITHLYVALSAQGTGIGRDLLTAVLDRRATFPDPRLALAVVRQNTAARAFYERLGGREIGAFIDPGPLWRSENIVVAWD